MKNKNIKVIDEHNIDRDASVMFAFELDGSEYVVYWISRDEESNNVFVSKVLKNIDDTNSMLNIDDDDKKKEIAEIVKVLISNSVSDQNDKLVGVTTTLSNGKVVKFVGVGFNKEQQINVTKTYITTVKKEVTKVAETYYDVVNEEVKVEPVLNAVPLIEPVSDVFPDLGSVESVPVAAEQPIIAPSIPVAEPVSTVVTQPVVNPTIVAEPAPLVVEPVSTAVIQPVVNPTVVAGPAPLVADPVPTVVTQPVVNPTVVAGTTPLVAEPVSTVVTQPVGTTESQPLVLNASKETNLNAALGEVANSSTIPVENIDSVREFGAETPVVAQPVQQTIPPMVQPDAVEIPKTLTKKAGFANSKFFMVVAIAFFLASCVFLGYEVFNYFQLVK